MTQFFDGKTATAAGDAGIFKCISCGQNGLRAETEAYHCDSCGASFSIILGVPLLLRGLRYGPSGYLLPPDMVGPISDILSEPRSEEWAQFLQEVFSYRYEFADLTLDAENNYFFNRIRLAEHEVRPPIGTESVVNVDVRYAIEHHLVAATLPCGRVQTRNVRLRNTGTCAISSRGARAVAISYQWRDARGTQIACTRASTPLPVDLQPRRALTVPAVIHTPGVTGPHFLELMLYQCGLGWLERDAQLIGVQLAPPTPQPARTHWKRTDLPLEGYSYGADHHLAWEIAMRQIEQAAQGSRLRILEVGAGCEPMIRGLPHEMYSFDIDVQSVQIGAFRRRNDIHRIIHIAADTNALPFREKSFDAVVIFAALHHFSDPAHALACLKQVLKPSGFLAILCEPVGHYENGVVNDEFHGELLHGINEQIFTEDEYEEMFLRAGLVQDEVIVDRGSLKAILRPRCSTSAEPLISHAPSQAPHSVIRRVRQWLRRRVA